MKFPYVRIPIRGPRRKWIARPIIPVVLSLGGRQGFAVKSVIVDALIDSGADKSLFHADLAKEIGLKLEKGEREFFGGIEGGRFIAFIHRIQLQIVGMDARIEMAAGFTEAIGVSALLGQEGFFDTFRITFERSRNIIEVAVATKTA